jgi:hypothetical protein
MIEHAGEKDDIKGYGSLDIFYFGAQYLLDQGKTVPVRTRQIIGHDPGGSPAFTRKTEPALISSYIQDRQPGEILGQFDPVGDEGNVVSTGGVDARNNLKSLVPILGFMDLTRD